MRKLLLISLIVCALLIGSACAADPITTSVTGKITAPPNTVTVTPPPAYTPWNLQFGKVNEITAGDIHIVSNCNYTLAVQASTGGYMIGEGGPAMTFPTLATPVYIFAGGNTWAPAEGKGRTELVIYTGKPGTVDIPLKLRQELEPQDADKINPKIVFTFVTHIL
jgi:hypothetical protein